MIKLIESTTKYGTMSLYSERPDATVILGLVSVHEEYLCGEGPKRLQVSHDNYVEFAVGRVVSVFSTEERLMSDVYGTVTRAVFLDLDGTFRTIRVRDDIGTGYNDVVHSCATVDADAGVMALYAAHLQVLQAECDIEQAKRDAAEKKARQAWMEKAAREPKRGSKVKVVSGRKIPVGTIGECFWLGNKGFGMRCGLKTANGSVVWVDAKHCETVTV